MSAKGHSGRHSPRAPVTILILALIIALAAPSLAFVAILLFQTDVVTRRQLEARAEQDRKTVWKLFLHFGPWLALRALTRTIGLGDALQRAGTRLGLKARLVPLSQAEAAIDVDKPDDHAQALDIWKARKASGQP